MAVVTSDFLAGLVTNYRVIFEDAFLAATSASIYNRYATVVPSNTDTESYNWLGTVPKMNQWLDKRQIDSLSGYTYQLQNQWYQASIAVDRKIMEDDKYSMIMPRIKQLGLEAARYPSELAINALIAGHTTNGYDGQLFFSTAHTEANSGTQSNYVTGTGTTLAQIRADFITARSLMRRYKDGSGRPMNLRPDLVIIPPDLEDVFEQLLHTQTIALASGTQQSNVLLNAVDILIDPLLTDTNDWFLLDTHEIIKPLIFQQRKAPEFIALDDPTGYNAFMKREFLYGVDFRGAAGYAMWQMAVQVTN